MMLLDIIQPMKQVLDNAAGFGIDDMSWAVHAPAPMGYALRDIEIGRWPVGDCAETDMSFGRIDAPWTILTHRLMGLGIGRIGASGCIDPSPTRPDAI
jgi:hypothetical protein